MKTDRVALNENSVRHSITPWLLAARPKTLPISFIPMMIGTFLAWQSVATIDWRLACLALFCSFFIQIGTNLVNDALDFKKGTDTEERLGPKRITQSGLLSCKQVLQGGFLCFALALLLGIPLVIKGGVPLLILLFVSVICGYIYTGGPWPLAYHGMGELFVFLFYGLISVSTVYYLQTGYVGASCLLAGTQMGLLASVPIAINNLRDIIGDELAHKKTLAVRFGKQAARLEISLFILAPYFIGFFWLGGNYKSAALLPLLSIPLAISNVKSICSVEPSSHYNAFLGKSVLTMGIFSLLLLAGFLL
jgi:1,4-dihydroxy-2-naphthoate octaprenyltransferase